MSTILTETDYTANDPTVAGYFRIGFVTLQIPPENIHTSRVVNNEKIRTVRGMNEMFQKTGQSRWDAVISWTALLNDASNDVLYKQWEDLCNIVAMFKAAPFVEVESPHLRQMLAAEDPEFSTRRLSMGLRQLQIDTHPDAVDALTITLTMTYFNALPYTLDFGYMGDDGSSKSAYQSSKFRDYISTWRQMNMDRGFRHQGDPAPAPWKEQNPGVLSLKWRQYLPLLTGQLPSYAGQLDAPATVGGVTVPSNVTPTKSTKGTLPSNIASIIQQIAPQYGLDTGIMQALCYHESSGNPNAKNPGSSASGLFQLLSGTAKQYGVTNVFDPVQNTTGACKLMKALYKQFKTYELALAAYYVGPAYVQSYLTGKPKTLKNGTVINPNGQVTGGIPPAGVPAGVSPSAAAYVGSVIGVAQGSFGYNGSTSATTTAQASTPATNPSTPPSSSANPVQTTTTSTEQALEQQVANMVSKGWNVDHRADPGGVGVVFLYKEKSLTLAPEDSASTEGVQPGLWPVQLSVIFINSLAQIPLAGYQYPTYQHVGPCSSLVQVSFVSEGDTDVPGITEPVHRGLMTLTSMAHMMEQQYQRLRTQFRSVVSVHRMQAVYVENQILNMLGIYGLMLDQVSTQTVQESANMATAQMTACQYENRFEELTPYRVNAIDGAYMNQLKDTVLNSTAFAQSVKAASSQEQSTISAAVTYRQNMQQGAEQPLSDMLLTAAKSLEGSSPFAGMDGAQTFFISDTDATALTGIFLNNAAAYPVAAARVQQLQQTGSFTQWSMSDYLMFKACAYDAGGSGAPTATVESIDQGISSSKGINRNQMVQDAYQRLFPYFATNDQALRNALNQIMQSPTLGSSIKGSVDASDPATSNSDHGAYRDMGLNSQVLDGEDFNPGMYFTSDKKRYMEALKPAFQNIWSQTQSGAQQVATDTNGNTLPSDTIPLSATTSIPGNMQSIMKMIHVPGYTMNEAFPTFKLFFMEDSSSGTYYAFDNFYSYATVTDIEVQRTVNKPATMRLQLTNLTHLLNHKVFDASLAGKWEATLNRFAFQEGSSQNAGPDVPTASFVRKDGLGGAPYQVMGRDNTEGYTGGDMANRRIPLQYFPLQTGSKVQLRVGFSNNPDKLTPIFCGTVTEIEGNEVLTITAQSFMLELITLGSDQIQKNSWFHLGAALHNTFYLFSPVKQGPAFGGVTIFGDNGDVSTVLWKLLQNSTAKHWGRWQINIPSNPLLKGFSWKDLGDPAFAVGARALGMDNVATALGSAYDRSGENIMVNTAARFDGGVTDCNPKTHSQSRSWMDERLFPWTPSKYYIDAKSTLSVWDLMTDIARRYPEYLLLEKWYGFPYSCDATLVFGHPFDWYRARPEMLGDQEQSRALTQNQQSYQQWWNSTGQALFKDVLNDSTMPVTIHLYTSGLMQQASGSYDGLQAACERALRIATDAVDVGSGWGHTVLSLPEKIDAALRPSVRQDLYNLQKRLVSVPDAYKTSMMAANQQSTDMLKPMRRYHFIDHQSIVHNGIKLNDKIYNAVRICDPEKNGKAHPIKANASIPDNYTRVLDVTDQINDPKQNVIDQSMGNGGLMMAYAQSFLREEVGKMYRGEVVLRGIPEIEPADVLLVTDPSTGMVGPFEVETVTHVINPDEGFITIVKPRAVVCINEAASAAFLRQALMAMGTVIPEVHRISSLSSTVWTELGVAGAAGVGVGTAVGAGLSAGAGAVSGVAAGSSILAPAAAATMEWAAAGAAVLSGPPGWIILGLCTVAAMGAGVWWFIDATSKLNPLVICPMTKFGRPWVGGIEGWAMNDLVGVVNNKATQFMVDEVYPLLDSWKALHGYPTQVNPTSSSQWNLSAPPTV